MRHFLLSLFGVAVVLSSCSAPPPPACGPTTCSTGCCQNNQCVSGVENSACGRGGNACTSCGVGAQCSLGICSPTSNLTGGGSANTGGGFVIAGGSTAGGSTAGGSTAGGSTAGGSTAGGSTAGGSTAGGSTAGGSTAGGSTAGGSTAGGSTAGGSTAGGSTAGGSAGGNVCAGSLTNCSLMCLDLQADVENCGQCGRVCGNGEVCNRGTCQVLPTDCTVGPGCGPGYFCDPISRRCMTGCRLSTDCPSGATCSMGQCRCPTGQHACGQQCVSDTAVTSCGTSCRVCPSAANGTATCNGSTCGLTCDPGYVRNGNTCVDVNECLSGNGGCSANAACTNTPGSRTCACNAGFMGDGLTCLDINECQTNNGGCDTNAACINTPGARSCTCNTGYSGNGLTCADVDECLSSNGGCSLNATCANTVGSRTCTCNGGYTGTGVSCADINECLTNNGGCDANAACANTPGSRTCTCNTGFSGSGTTCADINECLTNNGGCDANAACANTVGSRTCTCNTGFTGSGTSCTDVNECLTNNGGCNINALCTNTPGSRTCTCNAGYTGTGLTCTDVDECATNNGGCSANATCTNTPGTRTCACNAGYSGDGFTCTPRVGGETCELATTITNGQTLTSTTVGATSNYSGIGLNSVCEVSGEADLVFTASVPPGQRGRFTTAGAMDIDLIVGPASTCNLSPRQCFAGATRTSNAVSFVNGQATPQTVYAIVGTGTPTSFNITYQQSTPIADDSCATAVSTVSNGQVLSNQSLSGFTYDYECRFTSGNLAGADRVYRAPLPALSRLTSTMTPSGFTGRLSVIEGPASACDAPGRRCLSSTSSSSSVIARALNVTNSARDYFLVASNDGAATGTFSLSTTIVPVAADDVCTTATSVLASGATLTTQSLSGFESDYQCSSTGVDRVYLATVPAMSGLQVVMTPPSGMTAHLSAIAAPAATCDSAPVCLAGARTSGTAGATQTMVVPNRTAAPLDVFVVATASAGATTGTFSISAATVALPVGDTCNAPTPLVAGTLPAESIAGYDPTYDISSSTRPGCRTTFGDEDRVYVATVPAGQTFTVSATSQADLILNLIPGPAASCSNNAVACLASADAAFSNGTETVSWLNSTGSTATVFLVVTSFLGNTSPWSMTTTIQ